MRNYIYTFSKLGNIVPVCNALYCAMNGGGRQRGRKLTNGISERRKRRRRGRGKEDAKVADKITERIKRVCFPSFSEKIFRFVPQCNPDMKYFLTIAWGDIHLGSFEDARSRFLCATLHVTLRKMGFSDISFFPACIPSETMFDRASQQLGYLHKKPPCLNLTYVLKGNNIYFKHSPKKQDLSSVKGQRQR